MAAPHHLRCGRVGVSTAAGPAAACTPPPAPALQAAAWRLAAAAARQQQQRPGRRFTAACSASGGGAADGAPISTLLSLPLFPLPTVAAPAQSGTLIVYEPRYLELFNELQQQQQQAAAAADGDPSSSSNGGLSEPRFGHLLAPAAAPPALLEQAVGGFPPLGVCAAVKSVVRLDSGHLQVSYHGLRRFRLLSVDTDAKPFPVAAATWVDDVPPAAAAAGQQQQQQQLVDALELEVYSQLQQVAKYSQQLAEAAAAAAGAASSSSSKSSSSSSAGEQDAAAAAAAAAARAGRLPDAVLTYAPPPPTRQTSAEFLVRAGVPAGKQIQTWQRLGSVYGSGSGAAAADKQKKAARPAQDVYQVLRERTDKGRRQELFSFAAASVLELGVPERLALLQCTDTAARLQFVSAAVAPHLQQLVARVSVQQALIQQRRP